MKFNKLLAKHFKSYATVIIIFLFSFQALATDLDEDIQIEDWMTTPFEITFEEEPILENWMTAPFETSIEEEMIIEYWMTTSWI